MNAVPPGGSAELVGDPYVVLGVARDASAETIRRTWRHRARSLHPDLNPDPDAPARFAQLSVAYKVLSDPVQRRRYDEHTATAGRGAGRSASGPTSNAAPDYEVVDEPIPRRAEWLRTTSAALAWWSRAWSGRLSVARAGGAAARRRAAASWAALWGALWAVVVALLRGARQVAETVVAQGREWRRTRAERRHAQPGRGSFARPRPVQAASRVRARRRPSSWPSGALGARLESRQATAALAWLLWWVVPLPAARSARVLMVGAWLLTGPVIIPAVGAHTTTPGRAWVGTAVVAVWLGVLAVWLLRVLIVGWVLLLAALTEVGRWWRHRGGNDRAAHCPGLPDGGCVEDLSGVPVGAR